MRGLPLVFGVLLVCVARTAGDTIELINGDKLTGRIVEQSDETIVLDHTVIGYIEIAPDQIKNGEPAGDSAPAPETGDGQAHAPSAAGPGVPPAPLIDALPLSWWHAVRLPFSRRSGCESRFELGATGSDGNSTTSSVRAAFKTGRKTERDHWDIDGSYYVSQDHDDTTRHEFTTGFIWDLLMTDSSWLTFIKGQYDFDEFEPWENRAIGFAGIGYTIIDENDLEAVPATCGLRASSGSRS